jgi:hypothetical protein
MYIPLQELMQHQSNFQRSLVHLHDCCLTPQHALQLPMVLQ